jgi:hypothetical protein
MTLKEGKPLTNLYQKRVQEDSDLFCIVDDHHNRRGTGKTVLSLGLASAMDRTEEGLTKEKVALDPEELIEAYTEQPRGSALVLDEAEASTSKFRAGSKTNKAIRELVSMGRIEEKYVIMNLPSTGEMDRDLKTLASAWLMVEERGQAIVHFLGYNPYKEHPLTPKKQILNWTDITDPDLREVYDYLTEEKEKHLRGESSESTFVDQAEHQEKIKQIKEQTRTQTRNEILTELYHDLDVTQRKLANSVGLSRSRLADIVSE